MDATFYFYDLETSGVNPRKSRIMQFAGQRTDLDLNPVGDAHNILIKLSEDILPDPEAILITGITPQQTHAEGITEAEFLKIFDTEIVKPSTTFVGYNSIRFDDEFMRFLLYRNFHDPYAWQWKNGSSRWDLLDVVRMTRALRPAGIEWPFDEKGVCTNKLELLTKTNNLTHDAAHDALSDVQATIAMARLIKTKQPKLFEFLYSIRSKQQVTKLVSAGKPFIYTSGRYPSEYDKTTVVRTLGKHPTSQGVLVYNLRHDPSDYLKMTADQLVEAWRYDPEKKQERLPVKALQFNRCPAVAPLGVLDDESISRLKLDMNYIHDNDKKLQADKDFYIKISEAVQKMNIERDKKAALNITDTTQNKPVDTKLYDGFLPDSDRPIAEKLVKSAPTDISNYTGKFKDPRLNALVPLYKARNFSKYMNQDEIEAWEKHREEALVSGGASSQLGQFGIKLEELSATTTDSHPQYLLQELRLYAESIIPGF